MIARPDLEALDRADPLRGFRERFDLPAGIIYLDGNSLGALAHGVRERIARVVGEEWGGGLIRSWNAAGWISLPQRAGDAIARLVGARPGEIVVADSTSVNLFKALAVALQARPGRSLVVSERANFPTDLHIAQGLLAQLGARHELVLVEGDEAALEQCLASRGADVAAVLLTHVHYTTSRMYDMARVTRAVHGAGALAIWDLSHSAGVMPVDLAACDADFAVGCGYKHLNGGPGAPAFIYVARRMREGFAQPLSGWMGHARPFDFDGTYEPAPGITRYLTGTPPVVAAAALEASVELILEAPMAAIRAKSVALGDAFIRLMDEQCAGPGFELLSPRDGSRRGSHVSYRHAASYPLMQALITAGVIGDCRPPDLVRFGFAPLYTRHVDLWDAVERIERIARTRAWDRAEFHARQAVT
ncbi:MAG TPA: kynureninase [Usitatibacter sp.]|jgi:kynureninase|nr:kynureninase [Usitatibacter sp.]